LLGLGESTENIVGEVAHRLSFWHLDPLSEAGGRELSALVREESEGIGKDESSAADNALGDSKGDTGGSATDTAADTAAMFDLVLCNPPWVPTPVGGLSGEDYVPGLPLLSLDDQLDGPSLVPHSLN
jgi:hypothetical protein